MGLGQGGGRGALRSHPWEDQEFWLRASGGKFLLATRVFRFRKHLDINFRVQEKEGDYRCKCGSHQHIKVS